MWVTGTQITMTLKEKYLAYTDGLSSPQNYIEWSYRFMIAAALQRRVWYGEEHMQCFPNMYGILYGPPGVGKSIVLDTYGDFLKHHKKKDFSNNNDKSVSKEQAYVIQKTEENNLALAEENSIKSKKNGEVNDPPLFPYAPDATTYEALVDSMSGSFRRINYTKMNPDGTSKLAVYGHCSMYFNLDELGSLFRKKADSVVNYLLGLYGCPKEYEYKTKTSGEDRVLRGCLNFLAGTTPEFMEEVSNDKLIGNGFAARCHFICANKNRKHIFSPPTLTTEQLQYRQDILDHIKNLARLYGQVQVTEETKVWLQDWWQRFNEGKIERANKSAKLDGYYARRNIHLIKCAIANHFGQSIDMFIPLERFIEADVDLAKEEKTMHLALTVDKGNPLAKVTNHVYDYIVKNGQPNMVDLIAEFWDELPQGNKSMDEILSHLIAMDRIKQQPLETGQITYQPI
jgi:hypothetical protein